MGFLWVTGFSFLHCVASPFHSFVTTMGFVWVHGDTPLAASATRRLCYTEKAEHAQQHPGTITTCALGNAAAVGDGAAGEC